jgi:enoyl-CoA hydratase/carnithine racemase
VCLPLGSLARRAPGITRPDWISIGGVVEKVLVEIAGPVRTVTLNRPDKRNALDGETIDAIVAALPRNPGSNERVAVIRGAGPVFCSGMDLNQDKAALGNPKAVEVMFRAVETFPLPVVAVVHGHAIAGGAELALHCDFVVASLEANFGMSLAQIGLAPTWFLTKKIMEVAGPAVAREILLLGDPLPSGVMHDLGVIARAVASKEIETETARIVDRLVANAPLSLAAMKSMMVQQMDFRDDIPHADLNEWVERISTTDDAREGVLARMERRRAIFEGR